MMCALLASASMPTVALAQSETEGGLSEIVVTAQRRAQSLQDVPISVTAFDSEALARNNITAAADYLKRTPNVSFQDDGQTGNRGVSIGIRGVSDIKSLDNSVINSIGVYLDEFSVASVSGGTINPQLQDIERIEVLRGPQGTYFGRNAIGGALNIATKKPVGELGGEVLAGASFYENGGAEQHVTGILNVPVSETLWTRGVMHVERSDGYVKNVSPTGAPNSGWDYFHGRLSLRWMPAEGTTVDAQIFYTKENEGHDPTVNSGVLDLDTAGTFAGAVSAGLTPWGEGLGFFPKNQSKVNHDAYEYNRGRTTLGNLRISQELGQGLTLKSVTGFLNTATDRRFDQDVTSLDIVIRENDFDSRSWSQELRLEAQTDQFDLTVGGLYARDRQTKRNHIFMGSDRSLGGVGILPPVAAFPAGTPINRDTGMFGIRSLAAFADLTWRVTPELEVIAGGRYTHDSVSTGVVDVQVFGGRALPDVRGKHSFDDFAPRLSLRYKLDRDVSLYGVVSKGYKAGGVNVGHDDASDPFVDTFLPERLWNYEIGFKSELFDRRLRLNISAFYLDWKNLQLQTFYLLDPTDISSQVELTHNVRKARSKGVEFEFAAVPTRGLTISGGLGYLDAKMLSDERIVVTGGLPVDVEGLRTPKSPKWTWNLDAEYNFSTGAGEAYLGANWTHRSHSYGDLEATGRVQLGRPLFPYRLPTFNVVSLRAGLEVNERLKFGLFVENLLAEAYYTSTGENFGLGGIRLRPHPRIIGANVGLKF
ncbi:TonB-dependent receptor [Sphingomonas flavalba]|uniref:TonB-dependent receptor n=1 Tax=Sphingomonas flavalba TaxID=2559804 RepID=UPI0039E1914C